MSTHASRRRGFTLFEVLFAVALLAILALMLSSGLFLIFRSHGFTMATNDNTNHAGQTLNRIAHGVGSYRPLREAAKGTVKIIPAAQGGWTMEYTVHGVDTWLRYSPTAKTIYNDAGRVLGEDISASGVTANSYMNSFGITLVESVDIWISVQSSTTGRAVTETLSTRVQMRNTIKPDDED